MREGTETALLDKGRLDEEFVKRATAATAAARPRQRIRAGLAALIEMAETDPVAARSALQHLRTDHPRQSRLEAWLGGDADRATFGLGAAIQLATAELAADRPNLVKIEPDLLRWLEGKW
ncbi:MAG TPA: hypothetical protein VJ989_04050 [Solirubrobacterales bacterium]|nr:hypothetical protein [Solirubrobacterales bacterium]